MNSVENYFQLKAKIAEHAKAANRLPEDILLLPVTKTVAWQEIEPLVKSGCAQFGESRVQELLPKMEQALPSLQWHFIGSLQKNKVKKIVGRVAMIHSVDSLALAEEISQQSVHLNAVTPLLIQVNCSKEASKHGFVLEDFPEVIPSLLSLPGLSVQGFMTIAPLTEDKEMIRKTFAILRKLRDSLVFFRTKMHSLHHLSMGMSHDWPIAVEEGATILRVGTLIFGDRIEG